MKKYMNMGFGFALLIFVAFGLYSYSSSTRLVGNVKRQALSFDVHERLESLERHITNAEIGRYRYVLTNDQRYLKTYNEAVAKVSEELMGLRRSLPKNVAFQQRLSDLEPLIRERFENLRESVELHKKNGFNRDAQRDLTLKGTAVSKTVIDLITDMMIDERALFKNIETGLDATFRHIITTLSLGTIITFAIIIGIFYMLNREIAERRRAEEKFERLNRQNELILDSAGEGIFGVDTEGKHAFINRAASAMLGYEAGELIGKYSHTLWHHSRADGSLYPQDECLIYRTFRDGTASHVTDEVFWRKDGTSFPVEYRTRPIFEEGEIKGAVVTFNDITWRRKAEEKLNSLVEELRRSNTELEQFAYVASHDLKEPLLVIATDLKLLQRQFRDKLGPEEEGFILDAIDRANMMQSLISDLLAYSRAGHGSTFEPTDCSDMLAGALANLKVTIEKSGAVITNDALPEITADSVQVVQLLQNLIGNAVKFSNREAPRIHISAVPVADFLKQEEHLDRDVMQHLTAIKKGWVFSVSDNGIGIPGDQTGRIFEIFHRLHKDRYSGTGIGLATCKKIVERHKGRIWVKSERGKGSTFYFTVPDNPA